VNRISLSIAADDEAHPGVLGRIEGLARGLQVERCLEETAVVLETDIAGEAEARTAVDSVVGDRGFRDAAHDAVADSAPSRAQPREKIFVGEIVDQHVTILARTSMADKSIDISHPP
jgi:hypothetical protein